MSDQDRARPRAQYGEYATPEQQQLARGAAQTEPANVPAMPAPMDAARLPAAARPAHEHPVDRVVTLVLLAFGLFLVLNGIPGYLAMADVIQGVYDSLGAGTYPARDIAASLGITALVLECLIWLVTAFFSTLAIKRGRLSWWIALIGGAVAFITIMVIMSVALFADPGFVTSISPDRLP